MATDDDQTETGAYGSGRRILCLTGPESTGKTTLAEALVRQAGLQEAGTKLVPEVARDYLRRRAEAEGIHTAGTAYAADDVLAIARLQVAAEADALAAGTGLLVCDTDLTVIRVWWEERFGALPAELLDLLSRRPPRAYLLLAPDLPWAPDPLRENPGDRARLFERYVQVLEEGPYPYAIVRGEGEERLAAALRALRRFFPAAAEPASPRRRHPGNRVS